MLAVLVCYTISFWFRHNFIHAADTVDNTDTVDNSRILLRGYLEDVLLVEFMYLVFTRMPG